jgi:hypothetical protein
VPRPSSANCWTRTLWRPQRPAPTCSAGPATGCSNVWKALAPCANSPDRSSFRIFGL